jgi:DNA transposition AAA+ family ATPase
MNNEQKQQIANELSRIASKTSQAKVAKQAGVSTALVSQIINNNWKLISSEMWSKIQVTLRIDAKWQTAVIGNYQIVNSLVESAQQLSISIAISDTAGKGKTHALSDYERNYPNVTYIECKNYWTKKSYIRQLLINSGLDSIGTTEELINRFVSHLKGLNKPLLIIDQFDKLKDPQLDLFMDFYNDLNGHCGFVLSGVEHFERRIEKGVNKNKIGYAELYSRIGRKFIKLDPISLQDVKSICKANGVNELEEIEYIYANCEDDLRRVRRDIDKYKLKANSKKSA